MSTANQTPGPLLSLRGIEREFALGETRIRALRGIDLDVAPGEFMAIWGPSGSGKSTLLNLLGLIDAADKGVLRFEGQDVSQLSDDALSDCRNHKIGFVFQSFNLVPVLTALENVALPLQVQGVKAAEVRRRAAEWLGHVGLGEFLDFRPDRLSGGQRQRVAIARALVAQPACVLADEPTGNLDRGTAEQVFQLMLQLARDQGTAFVMVTHDETLAARCARQMRLVRGCLAEERTGQATGVPA